MFDWDQDDVIDAAAILTFALLVILAAVGAMFLFSKLWAVIS